MALIALSGLKKVGNTNENHNDNIGALTMDQYGNYFDTSGIVVDQSGALVPEVSAPSTGFNWGSIFTNLLQAIPSVIKDTQPTPTYAYGTPVKNVQPKSASTGINTNTLLLIAAAGIGVYFFTRKNVDNWKI